MTDILRKVNENRKITLSLTVISHASALLTVIVYGLTLYLSYMNSPRAALGAVLAAGVPFVLVSILRKIINAPRPYELYDFYEKNDKRREGQSFPSRHVFSAFVIATLALTVSVPLAIATYLLGLALAACRVLLGIHFVRDVVAGALVGVISGALGILIILI